MAEIRGEAQKSTKIIYVPGADNQYLFEEDVVVLDERLKEYPLAHEYIKDHELQHARDTANGARLRDLLQTEFEADYERSFEKSDELAQVRQYLNEKHSSSSKPYSDLALMGVDTIRLIWTTIFNAVKPVYWQFAGNPKKVSE